MGGGGGSINLVAMLEKINRGPDHSFGNLERAWRKLVDPEIGSTVEVNILPVYEGTPSVPTKFKVNYAVDGVWKRANSSNIR
jgi:DNA/RNA non-specific endonuclease